MQNNFPKTQFVISLIAFFAAVLCYAFSDYLINSNLGKAQSMEEEWQTESVKRENTRVLAHSVEVIQSERLELDTHFAKSSDVVPFLDTMEALAPKVGTKAEVTSVELLKEPIALEVGLRASGSFGNLYRFLTLLENSPYELEINSVEMHKVGEIGAVVSEAGPTGWNMVLKIKLLSFIQ